MPKRILFAIFWLSLVSQIAASPLPLSIPEADTIFYRQGGTLPSFIRFSNPQALDTASLGSHLQSLFAQSTPFEFEPISSETDELGMSHIRLQQMRGAYPIEGAIWILHLDDHGDLVSMGGLLFAPSENAQLPLLSQKQAFQQALLANPASRYIWEEGQENMPKAQLIWSPPSGNFLSSQLRLAYKFDIYTSVPIGRTHTYIDAITGDLLWQENRLQQLDVDSVGIAETAYSGAQDIHAQYDGNRFSLIDLSRGKGLFTLNAKQQYYWFMNVEPFYDDDNIWNNINTERDQFATDAHWGSAQTFDYINQVLGRHSLDNQGYPLVSHIHIGQNYRNAFWDGRGMHYGDGDSLGGTVNPLVSIDIVAHEIAHGLTQFTAGLIYRSQSGALNESYSDIMGKLVQQWSKPNTFNWILGEEASFPIRSMKQPNDFGHPNTYLGNNWDEYEGVHTNSGVQNHWFYLLTEGGSDVNDNQDNYQVNGLGFEKSAQIAFRSLIYYLHPSSTYEEARFYSLQAAADLYGACSNESEEVINAWYAVGVGPAYSTPIPKADFAYSDSSLCSVPLEVQFSNLSIHGSSYNWDFGDGNSSEEYAPKHTYSTPGDYSVSLRLSGECGNDEKVLNQIINVQSPLSPPTEPIIESGGSCGDALSLFAEAEGEILWLDDSARIVGVGQRFQLADFHRSATYHAQHIQPKQQYQLKPNPLDLSNATTPSVSQGQYFKVDQNLLLKSLKVFLSAPRPIIVNLYYPDRRISQDFEFAGKQGENTIELMQYLTPNTTSYVLFVQSNSLLVSPRANGPTDKIENVLQFTNNQIYTDHFFYDWQIETICTSEFSSIKIETAIPTPTPIDTTRCGPEKFRFFVPAKGYTVNWYDWQHRLIHSGEIFETGFIFGNTRYFVEREDKKASQDIGPALDLNQSYTWPEDGFSVIHFTVEEPIIFESFELYADSAAMPTAFLTSDDLNINAGFNDSVPPGLNRIQTDWLLPAGRYEMRGNAKHIHVQSEGLNFPYDISGLIHIDSISEQDYLPFFNWRVRPASCWSERVPININRGLQIDINANFDFSVEDGLVKFENLSKTYDRVLWDFGDGRSSTEPNPSHLFGEIGSYEVGLQVWYGGCSDFFTRSINIDQTEAIFQIYPNPARERVYVNIGPLQTEDFALSVFDMSGRRVFRQELGELEGRSLHLKELDVTGWSRGFYILRLRSAQQEIVKKIQVY